MRRKRGVDRGGIRTPGPELGAPLDVDAEHDAGVAIEPELGTELDAGIAIVAGPAMKYPKKLLTLRNLQGGQFGTLDVTAVNDKLVELDFGADFIRLSPESARGLVMALGRWLDQLPPPSVEPSPPLKEVIVIIESP